jgi:hypothetical protein
LIFNPSCARLKVIPEISPSLSDIDTLDLTGKDILKSIVQGDQGLVLFTSRGEIFCWDPGQKIVNFLYNLNREVLPGVFHQGNLLALEHQRSRYTIFDLERMKEHALLENPGIKQIVGLNHERVVFLSTAGELTLLAYRANAPRQSVKLEENEIVYNGCWQGDKIIVLSSLHLYVFNGNGGAPETVKLKHQAVSGFLLDGNSIYYGSGRRELVRFSLRSRKSQWAFKLGDAVEIKPQKLGPYIFVIPADNNIYFFNKNGTLYWWRQLQSSVKFPPVTMKENAAVFLWDEKVKFFNYKKKQVTTYPLGRPVKTNPLHIDGYIYIVSEDKVPGDEEAGPAYRRISKIGNHYGVEVKSVPQYIKPLGKSVRFDLKAVNLIDPTYKIKITGNLAGTEDIVFEKQISLKEKPSFVWVPRRPIEYRLLIEIQSLNKKGLTVEETFEAIDVDRMVKAYYYNVQTGCGSGLFD